MNKMKLFLYMIGTALLLATLSGCSSSGYYYGGKLMGYEIYFDYGLDKIYYSDSIKDIHHHFKREIRKEKLDKINENKMS